MQHFGEFLWGSVWATVAAFINSPWGMQSGAHLNPAITLTFFRLGKAAPRDMLFYSLFQVLGGIAGVLIVSIVFGRLLADPAVNYAVTVPGRQGILVAFLAETVISFNQMTAILWFSNSQRLARFTGCIAAALIAINISTMAPLSGMSMNPARSVASALPAFVWRGLWIYLTAPPLAMLLAAEVYVAIRGHSYVRCAKLHHDNDKRCIFCEYRAGRQRVLQQ